MLPFGKPISELIKERYSCRSFQKLLIATEQAVCLDAFCTAMKVGPLGTPFRFELVAANEYDPKALAGLGTYGLIKDPAGFIIGTTSQGPSALEDYGYGLEAIILYATAIGVGTCWLGGNFTRNSFMRKIRPEGEEIIPGVAAAGYPTEDSRTRDRLRLQVKADSRLPWSALFFQAEPGQPLNDSSIVSIL